MVLLHGLPTSHRIWDGVAARLDGFRIVAPDLPGFGGTQDDGSTAPEQAEALVRALPRGAHLVGMDYGGWLAAAVAPRVEARSLALMSTALSWGWLPSRLTALPPLHRVFYRAFAGDFFLRTGARRDALAAFGRGDRGRAERMRRLARTMTPLCAHRLSLPVLCLWGREDRFLPPFVGRSIAASVPDGTWRELPGRHLLPWDAPDAVADELRRWWAGLPGGRPASG